jgi:hypothetical protein
MATPRVADRSGGAAEPDLRMAWWCAVLVALSVGCAEIAETSEDVLHGRDTYTCELRWACHPGEELVKPAVAACATEATAAADAVETACWSTVLDTLDCEAPACEVTCSYRAFTCRVEDPDE